MAARKGLKLRGGKARAAKKSGGKSGNVQKTSDGHYVVIDGRRWRATNPHLSEEERERLVKRLMKARRDVGKALRDGDEDAERRARQRVHRAKVALGERGPKWWRGEESDK